MKILVCLFVFFACGIGAAESAPPEIGTAIQAERILVRVGPTKVVTAISRERFRKNDVVGITAYSITPRTTGSYEDRELTIVGTGVRRIDLAGFGAYVEVRIRPLGPAVVRATGLRSQLVEVYLEWERS